MATLAPKPLILAVQSEGEDYSAFMDREDAAFDKLYKEQDKLAPTTIVGRIVRFPYADGYAFYLVTKEKPLTLQHIPVGDRWQVPYYQIRGFRKVDILSRINSKFIF